MIDAPNRCGVAVAVLMLTACGGGGADGGSGGPADPVVLFEDEFRTAAGGASDLSSNWNVVSGTSTCTASNTDADVINEPPQGNPTPGLVLKCAGTITDGNDGSLTSKATYQLNAPKTFVVDARVDSTGTFGINPQPGMDFRLQVLNTGFLVAKIAIGPASVTYYMNYGGGFGDIQVTRTYAADGLFHQFTFYADGAGNAQWRRDGVLEATAVRLSTSTGDLANGDFLNIKLTSPPSTSTEDSEGHFDNVMVTAP